MSIKTVKKIVNNEKIVINLRYDDECKNRHKTFSITGDLYEKNNHGVFVWVAGGCLHEDIERLAPEFSEYIKWHLCGENQPLHYIANTLYFAKKRDFNAARMSAIWPDATDEQLSKEPEELEKILLQRLPALLSDFKKAMEEIGIYEE